MKIHVDELLAAKSIFTTDQLSYMNCLSGKPHYANGLRKEIATLLVEAKKFHLGDFDAVDEMAKVSPHLLPRRAPADIGLFEVTGNFGLPRLCLVRDDRENDRMFATMFGRACPSHRQHWAVLPFTFMLDWKNAYRPLVDGPSDAEMVGIYKSFYKVKADDDLFPEMRLRNGLSFSDEIGGELWDKVDVENRKLSKEFENTQYAFQLLLQVLSTFEVFSCTNVIESEYQESKLKARIASRKRVKLFTFYTLHITGESVEKGQHRGGTHASPRLHFRRGHIMRLADGRKVWRRSCMVGNREFGVVRKDYAVSMSAT